MEHITTTRSSAGSESRPLGGRKLTNHHATAEWCARQFKPKPDFDRFEAVQILEEIGTAMPARRTAELLGVTPAQVNRNENRLMALQLITFRDSPNHKRCGTRCPESGRITSASGIDLSPLGVRLHYLRQMRDAILETRRRRSEYSLLITRLRRRIRGIFSGIAEGSWTAPAGVEGLVDEFEALLESFCSRLDSDGAKVAETLENDQNMRPRHHDDATLGSHRCDAYTIQPSSMNQDTGSASPEADRPCGDMYGLEGGGSGRGGASSSPASRSVSVGRPAWEDITGKLRLHRLVAGLSREMRRQLPREPDWPDVVRLGDELADEMRINPQLYHQLTRRIGAEAAALSLIVVAIKHRQGVVYNPGGYVRGILGKIASGSYQLLPSIHGVTSD